MKQIATGRRGAAWRAGMWTTHRSEVVLWTTPSCSIDAAREVGGTYTAGDGSYEFSSLGPVATSSGYVVCFNGSNLVGVAGYLPPCYSNSSWDGIP